MESWGISQRLFFPAAPQTKSEGLGPQRVARALVELGFRVQGLGFGRIHTGRGDDINPALPITRNIPQFKLNPHSLGSLRSCKNYIINSSSLNQAPFFQVQN